MDKKSGVIIGLGLLLLSTATGGYVLLKNEREKNAALEVQLAQLQDDEKRHAVEKSISEQLEKIAFQQEEVANQRREEAERQKNYAQLATRRADEERLKAVAARNAAELSEKSARQARDTAEKQRIIAEQERKKAENAQKKADTLRYVDLGNALGLQSTNRYNAGDKEKAAMLAYWSWYFVKNNNGDVYNPAVYQALSVCSESKNKIADQSGGISSIKYFDDSTLKIITVSTYGEIYTYEKTETSAINKQLIFNNKDYNFRDIYAWTDGNFYALSSTGHLVIFKNGKQFAVLPLPEIKTANRMCSIKGGKKLLIVGTKNMIIFNREKDEVEKVILTDYEISYASSNGGFPKVFDTFGKVHDVDPEGNVTDKISPVGDNIVTAYVTTDKLKAYGTHKGDILLDDGSGNIKHLVGHKSKITSMRFSGNRLYSSSLDRTLRLWVINSSSKSPDPITLFESEKWILSFTFGKNKNYIWAGDAGGTLLEKLVSTDMMAQKVRERIQRDFTDDEWNYYIGKDIKPMSFYKLKQ